MKTRITLEYPNRRTHETTVDGPLEPGTEFELHGRRWRAVGPVPLPRNHVRGREPGSTLCRSLGPARSGACGSVVGRPGRQPRRA